MTAQQPEPNWFDGFNAIWNVSDTEFDIMVCVGILSAVVILLLAGAP
jgi:hypothetical protein